MSRRTQGKVSITSFALLLMLVLPISVKADEMNQALDKYYKALKSNRGASPEIFKKQILEPAKKKSIEEGQARANSDYQNHLMQNDPRKLAAESHSDGAPEDAGSGDMNPAAINNPMIGEQPSSRTYVRPTAEPEAKPPVDGKDVPAEIVFPGAAKKDSKSH